MQLRSLLTCLVGFAVAGSAVVYTHAFIRVPGAQQLMRDVVVATSEIPFGQIIEPEMLAIQSWPAHAVPNGAFSSLRDVVGDKVDGEDVGGDGRRAKFTLARGDVIFASKVSGFGEPVSITQQIDPAMRAVTIRINDTSGVGGLIAPADRIDLTLTRNVDQQLITSTIMQDVEVLGLDRPGAGGQSNNGRVKTVTLQVAPDDAQRLALAQQAGTLSISLRHIDAADRPALHSINVNDLTEPVTEAPKKPRTRLPSIVVNRRGERLTVEVPSG